MKTQNYLIIACLFFLSYTIGCSGSSNNKTSGTKDISAATVNVDTPAIKKSENSSQSSPPPVKKIIKQKEPKYHEVMLKETVYRIATMNGLTVDELKEMNQLESNSISPGQKLIVGYTITEKEVEEEQTGELASKENEDESFYENESANKNESDSEDEITEEIKSSNDRESRDKGKNSIGVANNKPYAKLLEEYHDLLCKIQKESKEGRKDLSDGMDNIVKQGEIGQKLMQTQQLLKENEQIQYLADYAKAMQPCK